MTQLYYTAPGDEIFEEVKKKAIELWKVVDTDNDKYGYTTEKINRIKDIKNITDNTMSIVAMFSIDNQLLLAQELSEPTREAIRERMIDGGQPEDLIAF